MGALERGPGGPWPSQNCGWVGHTAFGPTNNWPVCSLILHCGQLILRKISKVGPSIYLILRLKCNKFTFCWGSAPDPLGELTVPPGLCLYLRGLLLSGWRKTGKGEEKVKGKEGEMWREGFGSPKNFGVAPPMDTVMGSKRKITSFFKSESEGKDKQPKTRVLVTMSRFPGQ